MDLSPTAVRFAIPLSCGALGFLAAWQGFAPAPNTPEATTKQATRPAQSAPAVTALAGGDHLAPPGSAAARLAEIETMTPEELVKEINEIWESGGGAIDLFTEERVAWGQRMAEALCRHPKEALDFAKSLRPGHASKDRIRGDIFRVLAVKEPGAAIAALADIPAQGRRTAIFQLNKEISTGSPYAAELEAQLTPGEKFERQLSPIVDKAREPGFGTDALAEAARIPGLGVLGRAQARQRVLTTWMTSQPREFATWLGSAEGAAIPEGARNALLQALDNLPSDEASPASGNATQELRPILKGMLTPKAM